MKRIVSILCFLTAGIISVSCGPDNMADKRAQLAEKSTGDIRIAVVASWEQGTTAADLWNGVEMAVDETNRTGIINGRKLLVIKKDDKGKLDTGWLVAEELSKDPGLVAVIGHYFSFITLPCSRIYGHNGLLMISPNSEDPSLLKENNKLYIDIHPKSDYISDKLIKYAAKKGFNKIAIGYVYDEYGIAMAREFDKAAMRENLTVVDSVPFGMDGRNLYGLVLGKWKNFDIDAILFAGHLQETMDFLKIARKKDMKKPVLTLNDWIGFEKYDNYLDGVVALSYFDPDDTSQTVQDFVREYVRRYGRIPSKYSIQGYEAVKLLAAGMRRANSTVPAKVAAALRGMKDWQGVSGKYSIGENGGIIGKTVSLMEGKDGRFVRVDGK